jgi:penicillin-binding protein 1B
MKIDRAESWARSLRITFVCLGIFTITLAAGEAIALFYLYTFDRDPKIWSNVTEFFYRPKHEPGNGIPPKAVHAGSLTVRGTQTYAIRFELRLTDLKPSALLDCLLAAEDRRFYDHAGLDYFGVIKTGYDHIFKGLRLRGASTISNQLVRTVILADQSRSLWRKIPEILLTNVAERHFLKEDLLLSYVNNAPLGHSNGHAILGFSAAGEALFGKRDPKALSLSQACTLAGMLNRPNGYRDEALQGKYEKIKARRDRVLDNLMRTYPDRYPEKAIQHAKKEEVRFFKIKEAAGSEPRHLISYASQQLAQTKPGLRVYLTVDQDLQRAAENAINAELDRFDRSQYGFYNHLSYKHGIKQGRKVTEEESKLQAALVALDAKTGEILAMVGGRNSAAEFNRATQAKRAPGSLIKPFVYLYGAAFGSYGGEKFRTDTIVDPSRHPIAERYTTGGAASATVQLARSDNGAAVAIAHEFGISRVQRFIAKITGANPGASELLAIGAGKGIELTPLQLASAYTVFTNYGVRLAPKSIAAVYDGERKIEIPEKKAIRVMDAGAALTVARMLQSVIGDGPDGHYGTAKMARQLSGLDSSVALAGKTGTGDSDLWFVNFTPRIVVVVWVGFDNNFPPFEAAKGFTGSGLPLQIWGRFVKDVKKYQADLLRGDFEMPAGHPF